jgi:hypothetical protein
MKRWLVPIWILVAAAGTAIIFWRNPTGNAKSPSPGEAVCSPAKPEFVAARKLAVNHRLGASDYRPVGGAAADETAVLNLYLGRPVNKDGGFCRGDLRAAPVLNTARGSVPLLVPLAASPHLAGLLNAGAAVDVWRGNQLLVEYGGVLAVLCGADSPTPTCYAAVEAPRSVLAEWAKADNSKVQLLLRKLEPGDN